MHYRKEIDGLRAIAVLPVIFFHAGFNFFSGGFVGVDVFFVISGYLITSIILEEKTNGTFTLMRFYERRARRILPALFFVMFLCLPFAWLLMQPPALKAFSQSLIAVSLFVSNFLFWKQSTYFSAAAELKPLLHTWSLAVKEQYYVLFPLFLLLLWRLGKKPILAILILIACMSFTLAQWGSSNIPTLSFYLLPMRGWELLIGVFTAFYLFYNKVREPQPKLEQVLSLIGIFCIVYGIIAFDNTTPFPSVYTLIPTLGAALIILFATPETIVGKILSYPFFVGIGLISYSAYLWHQPLFAFARLNKPILPGDPVFFVLSLCTLLLAYFTWKYVEQPFRKPKTAESHSPLIFASLFSIVFIALGTLGYNTNGYEQYYIDKRLTTNEKEIYTLLKKHTSGDMSQIMGDNGDCNFWVEDVNQKFKDRFSQCNQKNGKAIIVLGDSHAMNIYNALYRAHIKPFMISVSQGGCRPHNNKNYCQYNRFEEFTKENKNNIDTIIFHQSGTYFLRDANGIVYYDQIFDGRPITLYHENIQKTADYLNKLALNAKVVWLGPFVEARLVDFNQINEVSLSGFKLKTPVIKIFEKLDEDLIKENQPQKKFTYTSLIQVLKLTPDSLKIGDCITFRNKDHFSVCGEEIFGAKMAPLFS